MTRLIIAIALLFVGYVAGHTAGSPLDPLRVAPHIYELAFENDRVRVLKRTIRNGETPPLVAQPDRVVIYLNPCAWIAKRDDGSEYMESFHFGEPAWAAAGMHGGVTANVIQQCSVIEVELK
jgi:hypothetical protein